METICIKCKNLKHSEHCYGDTTFIDNFKHYFTCPASGVPENMNLRLYEKDDLPVIKECKRFKRSVFQELKNRWKMFWIIKG